MKGNLMYGIDPQSWKARIPEFEKAVKSFYSGECPRGQYKGTSGLFGSYAQKEDGLSMIRLRMTAGRLTMDKLAYVVNTMKKYGIRRAHLTTCQSIQLHDIAEPSALWEIVESALDAGIVTMGAGGDNPRNIMCSPLTGVEKGEYFDVMPYAEAAGEYLMNFINMPRMPRKYKCGFSSSRENATHVTCRDMGFVARKDHTFDVYTAGGIGPNPKKGVLCAEAVEPEKILYYCKALYDTFCAYGNYEQRNRARTRYMQETLGGPENYRNAYLEKLEHVFKTEKLDLPAFKNHEITKKGCGRIYGPRIIQQKQKGLVAAEWHPIGGVFTDAQLFALYDVIKDMKDVELRIAPYESVYIINLTAAEARKVLAATPETAQTTFEHSVACIGSSTCQAGVRDSQKLLQSCVDAVRAAGIPDGALPRIRISGCPSSCASQQTGAIGFRGHTKKVNGVAQSAFMLDYDGCEKRGSELLAAEQGAILETEIPRFLVELGLKVASTGLCYAKWRKAYPGELERIAAPYLA